MELDQIHPSLRIVVLAHRAVRRDVALLEGLLAAPTPDAAATAGLYRWYRAFRGAVEEHCTAEEAVLGPALVRAGQPTLAGALTEQHRRVHEALELAAEAVELLSDADGSRRPALLAPARAVVGHLRAVLDAHLDDEEATALPALVDAVPPEELAELGDAVFGALPPTSVWFHRSWLVAALADDEVGALAGTPLAGAVHDPDRDRYLRITRPLTSA